MPTLLGLSGLEKKGREYGPPDAVVYIGHDVAEGGGHVGVEAPIGRPSPSGVARLEAATMPEGLPARIHFVTPSGNSAHLLGPASCLSEIAKWLIWVCGGVAVCLA